MTVRAGFVGLIATLALACSPGDRGALAPLASPGVTLVSTHGLPNDTARLVGGGVTADVTGAWSSSDETVEVRYTSGARSALLSGPAALKEAGAVRPTSAAWDQTRPVSGDVMGRSLMASGRLTLSPLKPGEQRTLVFEFDRPAGSATPEIGEQVDMSVPMPGRGALVSYRLASE